MKITNFEKKNIKLLTKEQQESYENAKICYICKGKFENKFVKDMKYIAKLEIIVIRHGEIEVLQITYEFKIWCT